jgi:multicomponent Na+:H+ antiporter subunit C
VETILAFVVGGLYAAGLYMMMQRSIVKLILGLAILSHAANLLIFTAGRLVRAAAPIVPEGLSAPPGPVADPLPQALILTAIVISFGVLAFAVVLVRGSFLATQAEDLDQMRATDT